MFYSFGRQLLGVRKLVLGGHKALTSDYEKGYCINN